MSIGSDILIKQVGFCVIKTKNPGPVVNNDEKRVRLLALLILAGAGGIFKRYFYHDGSVSRREKDINAEQ